MGQPSVTVQLWPCPVHTRKRAPQATVLGPLFPSGSAPGHTPASGHSQESKLLGVCNLAFPSVFNVTAL